MNNRPDALGPLLMLLNVALVVIVLMMFHLLFGDAVLLMMDRPEPLVKTHFTSSGSSGADPEERVVDGIHVATGLAFGDGFEAVRGNCTGCHSPKLITQNRATAAGWTEMIRWMQATQGLHDLGDNEAIIVKYLATHYAPEEIGRRAGIDLEEVEWYVLELE